MVVVEDANDENAKEAIYLAVTFERIGWNRKSLQCWHLALHFLQQQQQQLDAADDERTALCLNGVRRLEAKISNQKFILNKITLL
uniref:Uncharacterized protein n=1 Tax=Lymantria dispar multicapsid nuclear polyhedrosis virus TaxID=10449 RepID=A0A1B1MR67_NPVLD|nr:hypothetical protein [Lymantria dispar multiple nucleopolyhedrovirus]